ncbi:AAA family ATPase [Candidatus Weimeria sp. HCP3S3_B5]|uniref:AAA family ATPase n=1 Tax=Candidatus Weimeria sp. HCP3S3_B5 TaxID=3438871 RepID=UPI003F8BF6E8
MATADQIRSLVKAYSQHDDQKFKTVVLQIVAHEAKLGHGSFAQELKKDASSIGKSATIFKMQNSNPMLQMSMPSVELTELFTDDSVHSKIERILLEYRNRNKLYKSGLSNRRKILLEGAPGTGKTMTASIIASELQLPLYTVQMDKLVTKFMGETSSRLRQIFDSMDTSAGVYLFDEFDAIGADRLMDNEVGEMRRILNSFLQFIENDVSDSIIIAATNNPKMLDKALFRRFDDVIHYELPNDAQIKQLFDYKLEGYQDGSICSKEVIEAARGLSQAELTIVAEDAMKESILYGKNFNSLMLISLLNDRRNNYVSREA